MTPQEWQLIYRGAAAKWEAERRADAWMIHGITRHRMKAGYTVDMVLATMPEMIPKRWLDGK